MSSIKLDRTAFKAQNMEQAADHSIHYRKMSWKERLQVAGYLNSVAFNYPESNPPRMNKEHFSVRSTRLIRPEKTLHG
jgi:hypothetical protein